MGKKANTFHILLCAEFRNTIKLNNISGLLCLGALCVCVFFLVCSSFFVTWSRAFISTEEKTTPNEWLNKIETLCPSQRLKIDLSLFEMPTVSIA